LLLEICAELKIIKKCKKAAARATTHCE